MPGAQTPAFIFFGKKHKAAGRRPSRHEEEGTEARLTSMLNFAYHNPVRLVFGRGAENEAGRLAETVARTHKCLVVYGGGSIKRNGVYDEIMGILNAAGKRVVEFDRIMSNPTYAKAQEGAKLARENHVDLILAVGGGSVIDTAKCIALGLEYEGDCWDFFDGHAVPEKALPVLAVLTIPAAGSEQSVRCVISHHGTKAGIGAECLRPAAAIVNPECFMPLPRHQVAAGVVDMISHIMERYFTRTTATAYVDAQSEAAMRTAIEFGPKVWADARDYDSWCQIGMVGSFAHNGYFGLGREEDWACHAIEHEISGWNEAITHGMGLSVVIPAWMRYVSERTPARLAQFARNVFGIVEADDAEAAKKGIEALVAFYKSLGMSTRMGELGADECPVESLARHCCRRGPVGRLLPLEASDVEAILKNAF